MKKYILENMKSWLLIILLAFVLKGISYLLGSTFLDRFLEQNLLILVPTLLAINIATITILLTKLSDLRIRYPSVRFSASISAMRGSIYEQIWIIALSTLTLIIKANSNLPILCSSTAQYILSTLLIAFSIAAIQIVLDTAKALFEILLTEDEVS